MQPLMFTLKAGDVILLYSYRGEPRNQMCQVVSIRVIEKDPVKLSTLWYNRITRSNRLIVIKDLYSGVHYSVYDAFACGYKANWFDRLMYWIARKIPA